ncbi:MAG: DEAD/DEAH box helicase family protein [Solirubrobacteraceae bacterium]
MTPRAALASDRFSADQLLLNVSASVNPDTFDLAAYDEFIEQVAGGRAYQVHSIKTALRFFLGGRYANTEALARESYDGSADLQRLYVNADALVAKLPFADKVACTLDLATGTGKSFAMYAIARVMLNESAVDRVLVLAPSTTIEAGLIEKFNTLTAAGDLTDLLPIRPSGHTIPTIVDAGSTVQEGQICVENIHAAYERTGSSLVDSFKGVGDRALVISDEAHHVISAGKQQSKKWHDFLANPDFGFAYHLGVSGTCYVGNEYFTDVIDRYAIRDAINDRWVKEVYYLTEDDSSTNDERFQKLHTQHEKNRGTYNPLKPLTIAVVKDIKAAKALAEELVDFLTGQPGATRAQAEAKVLVVTSAKEHANNLLKLKTVDDLSDPTEWIVSVAMLTEGWDVKNVFQIYPHEKRAFNSKLLISQVLGRGLRRPEGEHAPANPVVHVFNHQKWGAEIDDFVAEILDQETTIAQRPAQRQDVPHFDLHGVETSHVPTGVAAQKLEMNKKLDGLNLAPQIDATEETKFVSATDATKASVLTTKVIEKRYLTEEIVEEVRKRLIDHDNRPGVNGTLSQDFPKDKVRQMIVDALQHLGHDGTEVTQLNRQKILNSFGGLRQRSVVPKAKLTVKPTGLKVISTTTMRPVNERISRLTANVTLFYDEYSESLGEELDKVALQTAIELDAAQSGVALREVDNSFDFKSPVNVVLADHAPERLFVQKLISSKNNKALRSWVKSPDTGFYEIEYAYQEGGVGRSKRGKFNPDFFLWLKDSDLVVVTEVKGDGDDSWRNNGKLNAARAHFETVNDLLEADGAERRYSFHFLTPKDYDAFFETVRDGTVSTFVSSLQAQLDAKKANGKK